MPLKVFYSDMVEDLAGHLKARLLADRSRGDPFAFSQVVVPNANIAKWLQIRVFAKERSLCAGVKFPFAERRLAELLAANLPDGTPFSLLPDHAYANAVAAALLAPKGSFPGFDALAPLRAYVSGDDGGDALSVCTQRQARMCWQLAEKMADLMDQYEVRRPEIVENWLKGLAADGGSEAHGVEAAEAALARILWGDGGAFPQDRGRLSLRQLYERVRGAPPKGPAQTLYFFGHSTLSLLQVQILAWLALTHDVVLYHNNVCLEYWGDIESRQERIRRLGKAHADEEDVSVENTLLKQWGVAGRETMRLLVELEEENDGRIDFEWTCVADPGRERPGTVLGRIQESVRRRTGEPGKTPQDASLQVVGVPGIRREVEMVYNAILGSVWKPEGSGERPWPDCSFSDIAVLVPDMAKYRPVIEAVFDARGQVPYGLIDTTAAEDSKFLAGFMALADMARRGLTRETLFAVLDNPCVQAALGFSEADVAEWRSLTEALGAFDGFEGDGAEANFSWSWALSRLRLARVADRLEAGGDAGADLPLVGDGGNGALKFSEVVELLYRKTAAAFGSGADRRRLPCAVDFQSGGRWRPNWAHVLAKLMDDLLAAPADDQLEGGVQRQIVQVLNGLSALPGEHGCEIVLAAVERFAGGIACRRGGYLTHGVTIAGLQPMRPVPFRQVFMLGLGANGFPGRTSSTSLDVRGAGWRLGDTAMPKVNRYLFLETVMSARDRLVLSYQNRDVEKDAELFPAGIVRELEEFAGEAVVGAPFEEFRGYPLLERGEDAAAADGAPCAASPVCDVAWSPGDPHAGILPTYSSVARTTARERMEGGGAAHLPPPAGGRSHFVRREVSSRELAEFLKSPMRTVLRRQLGIGVERYRDTELALDSPLGVPKGPVQWELAGAVICEDGDLGGLFRRMQLAGRIPDGFIGDFARKKFFDGVQEFSERLRGFASGFGADDAPLVAGWLGNVNKNSRPADCTLEPFMAFLEGLADRPVREVAHTFRVGVVDVANMATAAWEWRVAPKDAREYLDRLAARYWSFLGDVGKPSAYVDFPYRKLASALGGEPDGDWDAVLERLTAEGWGSGSGFDSSLVVERAVDAYRRSPAAEELKELYEKFYALPMSGTMAAVGDGGAE